MSAAVQDNLTMNGAQKRAPRSGSACARISCDSRLHRGCGQTDGRGVDRAASSRGRSGACSAFTLLEVLIALAIFAMAAVVLGATYVNALNAYEVAGRHNEYNADLRFVRAALLTEPDRDKAEEGGDLDLGGGKRAHWQADISPTETVDLFSVAWTCDVIDPARPKPYHTTQTFLLLRPTWSDPVERTKLLDTVKQRILEIQEVAP